jgi:hypothetical protein
MAVMAREAWSDERLDDLNKKVDEGFREMREKFRTVRTEMSAQNRMMVQLFGGMFATFVIGTLGTIATIITTA